MVPVPFLGFLPENVQRGINAVIAIGGLAMANAGWPPAAGEPPVLLFIGGILAVIGAVGVVDPDRVEPDHTRDQSD